MEGGWGLAIGPILARAGHGSPRFPLNEPVQRVGDLAAQLGIRRAATGRSPVSESADRDATTPAGYDIIGGQVFRRFIAHGASISIRGLHRCAPILTAVQRLSSWKSLISRYLTWSLVIADRAGFAINELHLPEIFRALIGRALSGQRRFGSLDHGLQQLDLS